MIIAGRKQVCTCNELWCEECEWFTGALDTDPKNDPMA